MMYMPIAAATYHLAGECGNNVLPTRANERLGISIRGVYLRTMGENMIILREFASEMEAIVAQNVLQANNIPSSIIRDNAGGMLPVLHMIYPVRIAVQPGDVELARQLLETSVDDGAIEDDAVDDGNPESPA